MITTIDNEVLVYTDSVMNRIRIESNEPIVNVEIFNLDGRLVFNADYNGAIKFISINTDRYEAGVYYISIVAGNIRYTKKITITSM